LFRTLLLILSGNAVAALLTLLRNLLVANLISVEDYGVAVTFAMVLTLVEVVSSFGLQLLIVQSRRDDPDWQAALQGFHFLRAFISASVLFFGAGPIAAFLGVPEVTWAYQVLALAPLMTGLVSLDIYRLQRTMSYLPEMTTLALPAAISLASTVPLVWVFGDYRAMLFASLLQIGSMMVISRIMAERPFRMRIDRGVIRDAMRFGWPLMINNILIFAVMNGEKVVVGREIGMVSLAIISMGFTLTLTPTLVMERSVHAFFMPQLSSVQDDEARFQPLARTAIEANFLNGVILILAIVLAGEGFVRLALGPEYAALVPLMVWLGILQAMRVFKIGFILASVARARTSHAMIGNMFRVLSLPLSWWAAVETGDLLLMIWIATLGEFAGLLATMALLRFQIGVRLGPLLPVFGALSLFLGTACLHAAHSSLPAPLSDLPRWGFAVACIATACIVAWTMRDGRAYLRARQMQRFAG
jgi:O-antigen/teichoic acid export membrane protein